MTKLDAMIWAAKLNSCLAELPDDAEMHGFQFRLDIERNPMARVLEIQLTKPLDVPIVVNGKRFGGWQEKRAWVRPDVYFWWAEETKDD